MELNQVKSFKSENINMLDKQLKLLLKQKGLTVVKVSKDTGINAKTLYNYLDGRTPRDLGHVKKLCKYFSVSSDFLLFGFQPDNSSKSNSESIESLINFGNYDVFLRKR